MSVQLDTKAVRFMSQDTAIKFALIGSLVAVDAALIAGLDLRFPARDLLRPATISAMLGAYGLYYHRVRPTASFVMCTLTLLHLVLFSSAYSVAMYSLATTARPLVDSPLMQIDQWFYVHVPTVVTWAAAHPGVAAALRWCYGTLMIQTIGTIVILGLAGQRKPLEAFMMRFMIAALLTAVMFYLWPADGPFTGYGYAPSNGQARYLEHFHALRSGERDLVTWRGAEGLITFPSFHSTWAILLALAFWGRPLLFSVSAIVNLAVLVSTLTTGWHYFADVLGGIVVCVIAVGVTARLHRAAPK